MSGATDGVATEGEQVVATAEHKRQTKDMDNPPPTQPWRRGSNDQTSPAV
jgi:hypothetical protein